MEKISFSTLVSTAYREIFTRKMPWVFGSLIALVFVYEDKIMSPVTQISSLEQLKSSLEKLSSSDVQRLLLTFFCLTLINAFGKGNLIHSLTFLIKKSSFLDIPMKWRNLFRNAFILFVIEALFFFVLCIIFGILSFPLLIAFFFNPSALPLLINLLLLTSLFFLIIFSLSKQFVCCYALLSPLNIRTAVKLGFSLLSKNITLSFFFFLFTLIISMLFTFFINIAILGITVLTQKIVPSITVREIIETLCTFIFFTGFSVFLQAVWILFFSSLAHPKNTVVIEEEKGVSKQIIPEAPQGE